MAKGQAVNEKRPNRLIYEKSPYLLQHAYNPVEWWPWCEEAFQKARREDKPIFLSIGYSTCHWCHVMEEESFEDPEVAKLLNEAFICIKVDREERPDIDSIYMAACQLMTGQGGWPLTVLLTPDGKPFFAATYIPKEGHFGRVGLKELIPRVRELWRSRRGDLVKEAEKALELLKRVSQLPAGEELGEGALRRAYEQLAQEFDSTYGGFGAAPKFPLPHRLTFLLRYWKRTGEPHALEMVETTLKKMRLGGIYDHVGFGFHRYSTDRGWKLPHFEKMLYDQALLAISHLEAYQATDDGEYARTAREIFDYVLRDLLSPEGGFYSAEDADSEGEEGKFYVWQEEEIRAVLPVEETELAFKLFNVEAYGNFVEETSGRRTGRNVLYLGKPLSEWSLELGLSENELGKRLEKIRQKLFEERGRRVRPHRDDKILADWNGLMIVALAKGAQVLAEPSYYAEAAERAAGFILRAMRDPEGGLLHRYREGEAAVAAFLDDYAFLIWGLIELYETTFKPRHLRAALELSETALERFWDEERGGFFFTAQDAEVLVRRKEIYDGAVPSGNSVMMLNLLRLGRMTGRHELEERAAEIAELAAFTRELVAIEGKATAYLCREQRCDLPTTDTEEMLKLLNR
jgi:hypothetical protein